MGKWLENMIDWLLEQHSSFKIFGGMGTFKTFQNLVPDWYVSKPHVSRLRRNSLVGRCTFPKKESKKYNVLNSTTNHPLFSSKWMLCTSHSGWHWQPGLISHHQASSSSCSSPNNFPSESCHGFVGIKHGCPLFLWDFTNVYLLGAF